MILEAAIDSFNIAQQAVNNGINRLEVCSDLLNDGLTPETDYFLNVKN